MQQPNKAGMFGLLSQTVINNAFKTVHWFGISSSISTCMFLTGSSCRSALGKRNMQLIFPTDVLQLLNKASFACKLL